MLVNRLKTGLQEAGPSTATSLRSGSAQDDRKRRLREFGFAAGFGALMLLAGCRQDMQDQPKIISQRGSEMFSDHRGARPQVINTVARGQLREDS